MLADTSTASELIKLVWLEYGEGCSEEDLHGVRKTGLFYIVVPDKTCKFKYEKCAEKRGLKYNFTILMPMNFTGVDKYFLL
jgi:hypothetical protein